MLGNLAIWAMNMFVLQGQWDLRTMRTPRRQTRRSHFHRRAQQKEPHRQGCGDGPLRIPIGIFTGR